MTRLSDRVQQLEEVLRRKKSDEYKPWTFVREYSDGTYIDEITGQEVDVEEMRKEYRLIIVEFGDPPQKECEDNV